MQFSSRAPIPSLAPFVESIWRFRGRLDHRYERILPTGTLKLLVNLLDDELRVYRDRVAVHRGAIVCGAHTESFAIDTAEQRDVLGVEFRPGGAAAFFGVASEMTETCGELGALWGRSGSELRERLLEAPDTEAMFRILEAALLAHATTPDVEPAIVHAVTAFARGAGVAEVTTQLGITPARFIRRFTRIVGLAPKRFARVLRFHRVLDVASRGQPIAWARVALDCGYFDQAHLIHEFRGFAGMNPTAYQPRSHADRMHVPVLEREISTIPAMLRPAR